MRVKTKILNIFSNTYFQSFFEYVHYMSLKGMNYGSANGIRESGELSVLKRLQKELPFCPVIFDVGANNGQYLEYLLSYFKDLEPDVHVFEPDPKAFSYLQKRFGHHPNVVLNNIALGDKTGIEILYSDAPGGVKASLVALEEGGMQKTKVTVMPIDDYCEQKGIFHLHFLKLDVEGFEMKVLEGGSRLLRNGAIDHIQLEHGSMQSIIEGTTLYQFTQKLKDYQCYHIKQNGLSKLEYKPIKEIYYNSNYYFKLKDNAI